VGGMIVDKAAPVPKVAALNRPGGGFLPYEAHVTAIQANP
jgi:hypothetical protein